MSSLTTILSALQNGVAAINNLDVQMRNSFGSVFASSSATGGTFPAPPADGMILVSTAGPAAVWRFDLVQPSSGFIAQKDGYISQTGLAYIDQTGLSSVQYVRGNLIPRTYAGPGAANPLGNGELIFNSTDNSLYFWNSSAWQKLATGGGTVLLPFTVVPPSGDTTGATDTGAINAVIHTAGGAWCQLLGGVYYLNAALTFNVNNSRLSGAATNVYTEIQVADGTIDALNITANNIEVDHLYLHCTAGAPTAGAGVHGLSNIGVGSKVHHLNILGFFYGIHSETENVGWYHDIQLTSNKTGMFWDATSNVACHNIICQNSATTGLDMSGNTSGCNFVNIQWTANQRNLKVHGASTTVGNCPESNRFYGCYFDNGTTEDLISNLSETSFVGCWVSNSGNAGVQIDDADTVQWTNTTFIHCSKHGCLVNGGTHLTWTACQFLSNGQAASNTYDGINISGTATYGKIIDCASFNDPTVVGAPALNQRYGINVSSAANARWWTIKDNDCGLHAGGSSKGDNASGSIIISSIGGNLDIVVGNNGHQSGATAWLVGTSTTPGTLFGNLPPTSCRGSREWVNDTSVTTFLTDLAGTGGAGGSMVTWSDGTKWWSG